MDIAAWVRTARKRAEINQTELGEYVGVGKQNVSAWENGRHEPSYAQMLKIQERTGFPVEAALSAPSNKPSPKDAGVAHAPILDAPTVPDLITWESVMAGEPLPKRFALDMPDDALAPHTPRGMRLIFETDASPTHGAGVLVESADGRRYVRRYVEGLRGEWEAQARNDAFVTLKSARDGLVLLAVLVMRVDGAA